MTRKTPKLGALRLAILGAVVLGLLVAPASAQADAVRASNCTAQVTATPGEDSATFTIVCSGQQIHAAQFTTSESAVIPAFQGQEPLHGLTCLPPLGNDFNCGSGPGPGLDPGETGTAQVETMDPCGANFTIEDLTLDTGPAPNTGEGAPTPDQDVSFQDVRVQCGEEPPPDGGDGGGGPGGDEENFARGRTFEDHPRGGVDAGFGASADDATAAGVETRSVSVLPSIIAGSALLVIGLACGGLTLVRRR
jgi:hypothetical protein